jgi:hypothetical protein
VEEEKDQEEEHAEGTVVLSSPSAHLLSLANALPSHGVDIRSWLTRNGWLRLRRCAQGWLLATAENLVILSTLTTTTTTTPLCTGNCMLATSPLLRHRLLRHRLLTALDVRWWSLTTLW